MDLLYSFLSLLFVLTAVGECKGNSKVSLRSGRKNYSYRPPNNYGDDGDSMTDNDDADDSTDSPPSPPAGTPPGNPNLKGYDYGKYYKGYPYIPYWKGSSKAKGAAANDDDDNDDSDMTPVKMMEMMMMMQAMEKPQPPKSEDKGLLSKWVSDPKSVLAAAVVPLSIILAAVVPVLVNYMMTGMSVPTLSTTASNKNGRGLVEASVLDEILQNFEAIARTVDTGSCRQKTLCQIASRNTTDAVSEYLRKAASGLSHFVKDEWMKKLGVQRIVRGLKAGKCDDVCSSHPDIK